MMKKLILICTPLVLHFYALCQIGKEKIKVTDLINIKTVTSVSLNSDGSKAAITLMSIEPDGDQKWEYKYNQQIYLVSTDGKTPAQQFTYKESSSQATFSPDGSKIAFVRNVESKPQIFVLPVNGGEAVQVTKFKYGATNPKWTEDGKKIIFNSTITLSELIKDSTLNPEKKIPSWSIEKPGLTNNEALVNKAIPNPNGDLASIRAYLQQNELDKKAKVINKVNFQEEATTSGELYFNHFFIVDVNGTSSPIDLTKGFYRYNGLEMVPGQHQLVFSASIDSVQHPDRILENSIYIADAYGNNKKVLLSNAKISYTSPKPSPDGKWLAFLYGSTDFVDQPSLGILSLSGNSTEIITLPLDRSKGNITWSNDGKYIYLLAQSNGGTPLYQIEVATKKVTILSSFDIGISNFDIKNNQIVYAATQISNPSEVFVANNKLEMPQQLTNFNSDWLLKKHISTPIKGTFVNSIGQQVEYWVMKPIGFESNKKYPLLLEIHGGPSAMWGPGEASMWHEFQYFCSQGYGVVYCNPRGSGGYGKEFLRANINDWGNGPTSDVLTALDKTVAQGWVDTSKLVVSGGSYAGYLVSWIIAHDHRFKAACSQRGVYDLRTFFGEGNAWRLVPNYFGGYPWNNSTKEILERESPINYVQNITTPYIIFHGENDLRTGVIQSEMLYRSLKILNRPIEYVRHPGATHEITRSGNNRQRIDQMLRTYEFFERWINH